MLTQQTSPLWVHVPIRFEPTPFRTLEWNKNEVREVINGQKYGRSSICHLYRSYRIHNMYYQYKFTVDNDITTLARNQKTNERQNENQTLTNLHLLQRIKNVRTLLWN